MGLPPVSGILLSDEHGIRETFHADVHHGTQNIIYTEQDVEPLIEQNKRLYNAVDEKARWGDGFVRVAHIPEVVYADLQTKGILNDPAAFKRWLNDADNRVFRVRPGRV